MSFMLEKIKNIFRKSEKSTLEGEPLIHSHPFVTNDPCHQIGDIKILDSQNTHKHYNIHVTADGMQSKECEDNQEHIN